VPPPVAPVDQPQVPPPADPFENWWETGDPYPAPEYGNLDDTIWGSFE
jgi:hypothetical protein